MRAHRHRILRAAASSNTSLHPTKNRDAVFGRVSLGLCFKTAIRIFYIKG